METIIKICGLNSKAAVRAAIKNRASYVGFTFYYDSPRNITPELAVEIAQEVPPHVKRVAVTSNPNSKLLEKIFHVFKPDFLQLDDFSTPEEIKKIKSKYSIKVIKTIYVGDQDDLKTTQKYEDVADMFMFDCRHGNDLFVDLPDTVFDWSLLKKANINKPWILSGGLNKFNVKHAIRVSNASIINASATLENTPGNKDPKMIEAFMKSVREPSYR
ncbi:MAG: hypothetical protein ACHP6I_03725 [Rickettsiales bacterium]